MKEISYMNDILIIEKIIEQYRTKVRRILGKLAKKKLRTKLSKYKFEKKKITFLGHRIERKEIHVMKEKL